MSSGRYAFKLNDTARLIRATVAAGHHVVRVEHDPKTGKISVITGKAESKTTAGNSWDDVNDATNT
jgi:hypothetical protein